MNKQRDQHRTFRSWQELPYQLMRKSSLIWVVLCWMLPQSLLAQFLQEGDTIAIISPSSATDTATINGGIRTLEKWGYHCIVGPNALNDYHGFAGTIDERLSDFLWALREPSVKAIMCSRGGDGAAHLLCRLSLDTLRNYPKMIIGFSDVTALLATCQNRSSRLDTVTRVFISALPSPHHNTWPYIR